MIQANELKIGNWVEIAGSKILITLRRMYALLNDIVEGDSETLNNITPIPLTPEILEKAGFKLQSKYMYKIELPNKYFIKYDTKQNICVITDSKDEFVFLPYIQPIYLHQLQNLYFALTGEELNIQL